MKIEPPIQVLLVEDDAAHVTAIQRAFEANGSDAVITTVGTLSEFRRRSAGQPPTIAVMDLNLPDGRAVEVLTHPPEAGLFPILVMTSHGNERVAVEAIKAGALEYVVKSPEAFANLPHTIARALHEWSLLQERKRVENALEFKNIILSTQQETAIDGILVVDENSGIISFNGRFVSMWGIPFDRTEAKSDQLVLRSAMDKLARPEEFIGKMEQLGKTPTETSRDEIALKDGRTFDAYSAPMLGENGKCYGRVWYFRDITENKRAEQSLQMFQCSIDQAFHAIFWMNRDGSFSYVNDRACVSLGYTREELLRLYLWDIDPAFPKELWFSRWEASQTSRRDAELHLDSIHQRKDGSTFPVEVVSKHLWLGEQEMHMAFVQDVTEKKKMESQLLRTQRLESVGRLASGIAHDLNNILAPMLMAPPLLREEIQDPELRNLLDLIEANAQRGSDIIKQLLTFGRGVESERMLVQLRTLVLEMADIIRETFPRNLTTQRELPLEIWPVMGDATQLHQVLMNLCVNARDAMPSGGTLILKLVNQEFDESLARMTPGARPGRYVCLSVTDSGQGIAPEHLDKIYDPFFTTKETGKGTGLGLSTVLGIVRSHGGFIQVHSQPGRGTEFKVCLPASELTESQPASPSNQFIPQGQGELVLMVDDEESVRLVMRQLLECNGYRMIEAENGTSGIVQYAARQKEVQVVLTDLIMPVMDGPAFIRVLRRMNPQVRVIVMTGDQTKPGQLAELGLQNEAHLAKPFSGAMLLQALQRVLHPETLPKN
jgi:PAS domain S-box-containing protein